MNKQQKRKFREEFMKYSEAVMKVLSDGEWHTVDEVVAAIIGEDWKKDKRMFAIGLCLDVLDHEGKIDSEFEFGKPPRCRIKEDLA